MDNIRTDVSMPRQETRVCSKCLKNKPLDSFSLVRGKHSEDRKSYCVQCEGLMKKARNKYGIELDELTALLNRPCSVCDRKAQYIDKSERINGVLCKRCWDFLKTIVPEDEHDVLTRCYNYVVFREHFPFWLKFELSQELPERETPLFDEIEQ